MAQELRGTLNAGLQTLSRQLVVTILSPRAGGAMARLALAVAIVPIILGLLIKFGHDAGLYSEQVATSLVVVTCVLVLLVVVWFSARSLHRTELERDGAEQALRKSEAQYRTIVEDQTELICCFLQDGTITFVNQAFARAYNKRPDELIGSSILTCVSEEEREDWQMRLASLTQDSPLSVMDRRIMLPGETVHWYQWSTRAIFDGQGNFLEFQSVCLDVTERKAVEGQLEHQAFHDTLTRLPNRALFMDRLNHALARARRSGNLVAVLFLDLDNFKVINDSLGHRVGDQLLIMVSERLQQCVRPEDTVSRLGGDEFTVLFEDVTELRAVTRVADRIAEQLEAPIILGGHDQLRTSSLEGHEVFITASIGIAVQASIDEHPDDLLRKADVAMYEAKSKGKARYIVYERNMTSRFREHLLLETELRRALERDELRVYYQPIVKLDNGRIAEVEALVRWEHPHRGLVPPSEFITAAEETGLIVPLGRFVMEKACRQVVEWQRQFPSAPGEPPLVVSVNLSVRQFQQPHLVQEITHIVIESGLEPAYLKLELTESVGIDDTGSTSSTLSKLRKLGFHLALDDFGMGYSALSYLKRYPFDTLKLDRTFVAGLGQDRENTAIVHAAVAFAKALSMRVTAEGIETKEQLIQLFRLGCDQGQGYYFSRPLPPEELSPLLANPPWIKRKKLAGGSVQETLITGQLDLATLR